MECSSHKSDSMTEKSMIAADQSQSEFDTETDQDSANGDNTADEDSSIHTESIDCRDDAKPINKDPSAALEPVDETSTTHQGPADTGTTHSTESPERAVLRHSGHGGSVDAAMESADDGEGGNGDDDADGGATSTRDLPDEILEHMLTFVLPYEDMQNCKLVSCRWYHAIKRELNFCGCPNLGPDSL